jgi:hypothetical protein
VAKPERQGSAKLLELNAAGGLGKDPAAILGRTGTCVGMTSAAATMWRMTAAAAAAAAADVWSYDFVEAVWSKIKTVGKAGVVPCRRGLAACRPLRFFLGAINGALCGSADKRGRLMEWARILAYITGSVDQELLLRNEYLAAENRVLRGQLKGRLKLSDAERARVLTSSRWRYSRCEDW